MRTLWVIPFVVLLTGNVSSGQEWARKMFKTRTHDFGVLARGSKPEFIFEVTNEYEEDVHITGVRSSCGCTIPVISQQTLKTWETGQIVCQFDTVAHIGIKTSVVTVTFDQPFPAEVQLNIRGHVRRDVVMQPGVVEFGKVRRGVTTEKTIAIEYAGRPDWQIVDVRSTNSNYEVELEESVRTDERVSYVMLVRLKPTAEPGYLHDRLTLVTNDAKARTIELPVEGRVLSSITVSPASLALGDIPIGEQKSKKIVVRGDQPFRIVNIECEDDSFEFETSAEPQRTHILPVTFAAQGKPRKVNERIHIETDLGSGSTAEFLATGNIVTSSR
ncbi:MAG: DUF1573 domain-containing protein [Pirellulaceae bacterium]|nr:DUF1573 domain-containing protein [Pirellulaceae bacterium]